MTNSEKFHDTSNTEDWTDDDGEVRELTAEDFARMVPFSALPPSLQEKLKGLKNATIRHDPVRKPVAVSADILDRFAATGEGWEDRVDGALRQWLDEHPLLTEHAQVS